LPGKKLRFSGGIEGIAGLLETKKEKQQNGENIPDLPKPPIKELWNPDVSNQPEMPSLSEHVLFSKLFHDKIDPRFGL
jgi:hypothetical protein